MNSPTVPSRQTRYALAATIALLTFAVYLSTLRNGFIDWDDDLYVYNNPWIRSWGFPFIKWAFTNLTAGSWFPLTWMSYALDHGLWGSNPAGYHLTNNLLHAANAFLVVWLVFALFDAARERGIRTGDRRAMIITTGVAGVLFGVHPLRVESVAWIAERKDVLCAFFFLLGMLSHLRYARKREPAPEHGKPAAGSLDRRYALTLLWFCLALMSKPMAVTFPAVLLVIDWYPLQRISSWRSLLRTVVEKLPFFVVSLAVALVTVKAQHAAGYLSAREVVPLMDRLLVAARAIVLYCRNMLLPLDLMPLYPYPEPSAIRSLPAIAAAVAVCGITVICVLAAKRRRLWFAAWGYFLVTLLPVLGLIQAGEQAMADRYTYLPGLGPAVIAGLVAAQVWAWTDALRSGRLAVRCALGAAAAAFLLLLCSLTVRQTGIWRDSVTLWDHVIEREPVRLYIAYNNRGVGYKDQGRYAQAIDDYTKSLALNPAAARPLMNRAIAFAEQGELARAIEDFNAVIDREPDNADAYSGRGLALIGAGRYAEAIEDCSRALRLQPAHVDARLNRGVAYERMGRFEDALDEYGRAIVLSPFDHLAYVNRGGVLARQGRLPEALGDYTRAIKLRPGAPAAYAMRGKLYRESGEPDRAQADYEQACGLGLADTCDEGRGASQGSGPRR